MWRKKAEILEDFQKAQNTGSPVDYLVMEVFIDLRDVAMAFLSAIAEKTKVNPAFHKGRVDAGQTES